MSNTSAAATGASWLPSAPAALMLGRAKARANSAIAPARSSSKIKCRNCNCRRLACSRRTMNRTAGNTKCFGTCRITRCSTIGTATRAAPMSIAGVKKLNPIASFPETVLTIVRIAAIADARRTSKAACDVVAQGTRSPLSASHRSPCRRQCPQPLASPSPAG